MTELNKPVTRVASLDEFQPEIVDVRLEFTDHVAVVPMRRLSYAELQAANKAVPDPKPPVTGASKDGPIIDFRDPGYLRASMDAAQKRQFYYLARSLQVPIPGATDDAKVAYLESLNSNFTRLLLMAVAQMVSEGEAYLDAQAQFPDGGGTAAGAGMPALEPDASRVSGTDAG